MTEGVLYELLVCCWRRGCGAAMMVFGLFWAFAVPTREAGERSPRAKEKRSVQAFYRRQPGRKPPAASPVRLAAVRH